MWKIVGLRFYSLPLCLLPSSQHICSNSPVHQLQVTMSQLMERWPWPTKKQTSDPCACQPPAVKLVLWASPEDDPFRPPNKISEPGRKPRRRWSKLPLRPFPTSLSAKMGWLTGESAVETPAKQNAVFRSNSFRFERPIEDEGRIKGPVKSYSITGQDVSSYITMYYNFKLKHHFWY